MLLLSAVSFPLVGKLGDLYGHRRVFLWGFAGASAVAALTALAWDVFSLIGLRTVAAVLGGATQPTSMALLFAVNPKGGRVRAMGWWSMTAAGAPALGLVHQRGLLRPVAAATRRPRPQLVGADAALRADGTRRLGGLLAEPGQLRRRQAHHGAAVGVEAQRAD